MKPDILLVHFSAPKIVPALAEHFTIHPLPEASDRDGFIAAVADRIRAMVTTTFVGADATLINALPNLEIIANAGGHIDKIDLGAARARGIPVIYTPRLTTEDVADVVIGLLLGVARRIAECDRFVRADRWLAGQMPFGTRVNGKKLGIVGLGRIGRAVAKRALGFAIEVGYHGPRRKPDVPYRYYPDLVEMARAVDFLAVTCGTGPDTRHLIDAPVMAALGAKGVLVNVARGSVDEAALVSALAEGRLAGAGLDVFEDEPQVPAALKAMEQVVLMPHTASGTVEAKQAQVELVVANLRAHFAGQPLLTPAR